MITRRELLLTSVALPALAWTGTTSAQTPAKVRRIGLLSPWTPSDTAGWHQSFRQGLRDLGWVEGKNIGIEYSYAEGRDDRLPDLAAGLVRHKVEVIVASNPSAAQAAQKATRVIPIVIVTAGDPVALGLVESLARPGGNVTGLSTMSFEMGGKRLELLKEIVPKLSRVDVIWNPQGAASTLNWKEIQLPARQLGIQLHSLEIRSPKDFDQVFENTARARAGALAILPDASITPNLKRIADLAAKNRLPSIFHFSEFVDAGGLVAYGPDRADMYRRIATYVDKILKGAKPTDLPVELPTKFEMVINMKTAKALGITIPPAVLVRANRVIE